MKPSKQAKKAVLELLKSSSKSEQDLVDKVVNDQVSRKHVAKALQKLMQKGEIILNDGNYSLKNEYRESKRSIVNDEKRKSSEEEGIPIAEILRRRQIAENSTSTTSLNVNHEELDIDDEIQRLEAELAADDDDSEQESETVSDDDEAEERDKRVSFGKVQVKKIEAASSETKHISGDTVVCLSAVAQDRIAPLPESCLPKTKKRSLRGIDEIPQQNRPKKSNVSTGLRDAVKEVLSSYVARSSERLPFYCRVCAVQETNEQDFFEHKATDFHKAAVEVERKASFCKLCRKQFTSPVQLKEHISSRPHKERLAQVRSRQARC